MTLKHRLIAVLLVYRGQVVQTRKFKRTNMVGHAYTAVDFFNAWAVDEIMVLEISEDSAHLDFFADLVDGLSKRCFVPLAVGGKIADLHRVHRLMRVGADKVVVNTNAVRRPALVTEIASTYGSQCVVVSIDAGRDAACRSGWRVFVANGAEPTGLDVLDWAAQAQTLGAGEIMVNAIDRDGDKRGYDLELVRAVSAAVRVPVIAMGGVGKWEHLVEGIAAGADAAAAGNIFHYTEHSTKKAKEHMARSALPVRESRFYRVDMPRRPKFRPFG